MLLFRILIFICLLGNNLFSADEKLNPKDIQLGFASIEIIAAMGDGESQPLNGVVIRVTSKKKNIESYGLSIDPGLIVLPLPPGDYCYEVFSHSGKNLQVSRKASERCFSIKRGETTIIGIRVLEDIEPSGIPIP